MRNFCLFPCRTHANPLALSAHSPAGWLFMFEMIFPSLTNEKLNYLLLMYVPAEGGLPSVLSSSRFQRKWHSKRPKGQPSEDEICAPCVAWKTKTHFWQIKLKCATFWMEWKMPSEMSWKRKRKGLEEVRERGWSMCPCPCVCVCASISNVKIKRHFRRMSASYCKTWVFN